MFLLSDERVGGAPKDVIRKWVHVAIQAMYGAYMATSFDSVNKRALADVVAKYETICFFRSDFDLFVATSFLCFIRFHDMDIDRALTGLVNSSVDGNHTDSQLISDLNMPVTPVTSGGDNLLSLLDEAQLLMSIAAPVTTTESESDAV